MLAQMPGIAAGYNIAGIFDYVAQLAGMKNIEQFKVEVTPDRLAMAQLKAGQATPIDGGLPEGAGYSGDSPAATLQ